MKLSGRRESSNVEDRRGGGLSNVSTGKKGGCLSIIVLIIGYLIYAKTGNSTLLEFAQNQGNITQTEEVSTGGQANYSKEEQELASFSKKILASTEDVWTKVFDNSNLTYHCPKMVLFKDGVNTGCGSATSATGPFYCSADQAVYLDLSFFTLMKRQLGADGDFAYAYVIAHEVGHHVEYETGLLQKLHQQMNQCRTEAEANKISVRIELLADFYAGVWGYYENKTFKSLEDGDLQEAINCAHQIGDDYLQKSARGTVNAKEFTHGTSAQRMKWLKLGLTTGDLSRANDILTCSESQL
ncbi:MAG: neutral zinc metallopeptidase [Bacteroidales bacterium]|nr:neutral zinc metallopeptidase [Bacteroidales bacterium]